MLHKLLPAVAALLLLAAPAAQAQTQASSPARQRTAERRALREARRTETPYADSHLGATRRPPRRGESAPLPAVAGEPKFDRDGTPHVTEPKYPGLRLRKRKPNSSN
jgi:Ni/Co efflux regulator RcnB